MKILKIPTEKFIPFNDFFEVWVVKYRVILVSLALLYKMSKDLVFCLMILTSKCNKIFFKRGI